MTTHLGLQRTMIPGAQASALTTGSISLAGARGQYVEYFESWESIASITATGSSNSITFSSIPQTYKHLHIRGLIRNNANVGGDAAWMRINGDTGSNYDTWKWYSFNQSGVSAGASGNVDYSRFAINTADSNSRGGYYSPLIMDIPNYAQSSYHKTMNVLASGVGPTSYTNYFSQSFGAVAWKSTSAINSITFGVWTVGSSNGIMGKFELFGVN